MPGFPKTTILLVVSLALSVASSLLTGCGQAPSQSPLNELKASLKDVPTYSIILDDMKDDGNFFKKYYHKYRVVQAEDVWSTDWLEVSKKEFQMTEGFLGMSLATKKEGEESTVAAPPGYDYVGDERYGRWRQDSQGNSFWEFYGKYALISQLFGGWYRPVYRNDYDAYRSSRTRNQPFFGRKREFGTTGSVVKKHKPNFYASRMARQGSLTSRFKDKVSSKIGRTKTSSRRRSSGFGK